VAVYVVRMKTTHQDREVLRLTGAGCNPGLGRRWGVF
jgi:hypothetical protein